MKPSAIVLIALTAGSTGLLPAADPGWTPLFTEDGVPKGWMVRAWDDVRNPAKGNPAWKVEKGVLTGGEPRGSWLLSEKEYGSRTAPAGAASAFRS
jgi:hypothetical protein